MRKTYYSVQYGIWGANKPGTAWFDNKEEADRFAAHDYRDDPVRHTYSREDSIRDAEELVMMTRYALE